MRRKVLLSLLFIACCSRIASAQVSPLPFTSYIETRSGLGNTGNALQHQKKLTVAFLGGSITHNPGWRDMVCAFFKEHFPMVRFKFIAAGIPSLGSLPHAFRLQRDVLDSGKVDLLFLEAAVNDQVNNTDSLTQVKSLEGIVRHARKSNPFMDIVLMSFADPDKTTLFQQGLFPVSVANHELIASHYQLPSINLAKAVSDKMKNKEFDWNKDFIDIHPSPFGQQLYFSAIKELLSKELIDQTNVPKHKRNYIEPALLNSASFTNGSYLNIESAIHDQGWTLNKNWTPSDGIGVRDGFVKVPMLVSSTPGSSLTLRFKGNAVGMAIVSGSDAGIVNYCIDNGQEQKIDLFTPWSLSLHLPWYVLFTSGLANTNHELKLTLSNEKNANSKGTACRIAYFLLNQ